MPHSHRRMGLVAAAVMKPRIPSAFTEYDFHSLLRATVILHRIESRRRIQESLWPEMRFEFRHQRIALGLARALHGHAALIIRRRWSASREIPSTRVRAAPAMSSNLFEISFQMKAIG